MAGSEKAIFTQCSRVASRLSTYRGVPPEPMVKLSNHLGCDPPGFAGGTEGGAPGPAPLVLGLAGAPGPVATLWSWRGKVMYMKAIQHAIAIATTVRKLVSWFGSWRPGPASLSRSFSCIVPVCGIFWCNLDVLSELASRAGVPTLTSSTS
jgi:hypothetical protein